MPNTELLDEAVAKAADEVQKALPQETETQVQEPEVQKTEEQVKEEKTAKLEADISENALDEYGLDKKSQTEAKQLFAAIKDPQKAPIVIDFLARQLGYQPPETKKEAQSQTKDIVDELKESLGPELEYIADKMGPVIKKHLNNQVEAARAESQAHINQIQTERLETQFDKVQKALAKQYFSDGQIPEKLASEMLGIMDILTPSEKQTPEQYLEDVMFLAARRTGTEVKKLTQQQKIERSRNNVPSRLQESKVAPRSAQPEVLNSKTRMTLDDSIRAAMSKVAEEIQ